MATFKILQKKYKYLLPALPILLFFLLFFVYPSIVMVKYSFNRSLMYGEIEAVFTMENYINFFTDPFYLKVLWRSMVLAFWVTVCTIPFGYILAYGLWTSKGLWRKLLYFCILLPLFTNLVVRLYGWRILLSPMGPINEILRDIGVIDKSLSMIYTLPAVVIGLVSECAPYFVLILFSVLTLINPRYIDAALDLGASRMKTFFKIIWPLSMPGVISGGMLTFIWSFGAFATPTILGKPIHWTPAIHAERQILSIRDWPFGTAIGISLVVIVLIVLFIQSRIVPKVHSQRKL
ncbi:ABC transporter permease [Desulforhopalus singaporensis]|uniref:ABC transporter permease n=1 Tax=Desulforhopalus singaporensis TaxID=91360 RepID=UPI0015A1FFA8|nr:ABC transporter permease [Desulforhopalus singaporensis]